MSKFQKIQIALLATTIIAAFIIGFQQNRISQNLVDLEYTPVAEIVYIDGQFRIINRGDKHIFVSDLIFHDKFSDESGNKLSNETRIITPGSYYYYPASLQSEPLKSILAKYKEEIGSNGTIYIPIDVLIKSATEKKYIAKNLFVVTFKDDIPNICMQTIAITQGGW